jgi:cell division protein FtsA
VLEVANPSYTASISTFELAQVIKPRVVEILDLVRQNIEQRMGALELLAGSVVITGGASLMPGLDQVASERFRLPVRIGKPEGVSGLVDVVASPAHATAVGLVRYGMLHTAELPERARSRPVVRQPGILTNIRKVLKDFF